MAHMRNIFLLRELEGVFVRLRDDDAAAALVTVSLT